MRGQQGEAFGVSGDRLRKVLSSIRTRWRMRRTIGGLVWLIVAALAAAVITGFGLEATRFSAGALLTFRLLTWGAVIGIAVWKVILPWFQKVSDEQVALYLEEHEPTLQAAILGAVEAERSRASGQAAASPQLLDQLVRRAVESARGVQDGRQIDQPGLYRSSGVLAAMTLAGLALLLFGPASFQRGASSLLPTRAAADINPYSISVEPGNLTVARGSDQFIAAELVGFGSEEVTLFRRAEGQDVLQQLSMIPTGEGGRFELLLLGLEEGLEYFVESDGVRSPTFEIEVVDLPYVETMTHEYRWPTYTGIPVERVENAGDIAVLPGTRVRLEIASTIPTDAGRLVIDDDEPTPLTVSEDGTIGGEFVVRERGFYRIEMAMPDGRFVSASPEYRIDLLSDRAPTLSIEEPGRDTDASAIEEVYIEAKAEDDYGIANLRLVYSVNGQPEDTIALFSGSNPPLEEVTAAHTFFLEEFDLEDGDLISYYAIAQDQRAELGDPISSDIYFLTIRPFRRDFREAPAQEGGPPPPGGGGEQPPEDPGLSELQRQVIAATFNLNRDRNSYTDQEFGESTRSVALAQGRVREQVATLSERMTNRGLGDAEEQFRQIAAEMLPEAIEAMDSARVMLDGQRTQEALPPEQQALRVLLKAEETYERLVQLQQQQQGGGGGGGGANADDLADLFELELDKLENQYETVQQGERQQSNQQVDELLQELEELARRQQQEAERQQARGQQQQNSSAGGGSSAQSQRELADQAEEAARQLQQLSREQSDPELADAARELQEAADAMRRAAANGDNAGAAEARRALQRLNDAQRRLEGNRDGRIEEDTQSALDQARSLADRQEDIREQVDNLPTDPQQRGEAIRDLQDEKTEMSQEVSQLRQRLQELAAQARSQDAETSRALADAADIIEETGLESAIAYSRGVVEARSPEFARIFEEQIQRGLDEVEQSLETASGAAERAAEGQSLERALDQAQDLQQGAESLARRLEQRGQQQGEGQQGQQQGEGQQGQQQGEGQQGQQQGEGQQGQQQGEGQQGQQQGEGQQGQQQGEGQQGQQQGEGQQGQQQGEGQQGQQQGEGQQGQQQGQGGQNPQGGAFNPTGRDFRGGSATRGNPQPFTDEERRQYQREFQQRLQDAVELQNSLEGEERNEVEDLNSAIADLQRLTDASVYDDLPQVAMLQQSLRESLSRLEFSLRREVEGESSDRAALTGSGEVPAAFRGMVEEYYRALARSRAGGGGD